MASLTAGAGETQPPPTGSPPRASVRASVAPTEGAPATAAAGNAPPTAGSRASRRQGTAAGRKPDGPTMSELLTKKANGVIGALSRTGGTIAGTGASPAQTASGDVPFNPVDPLTIALADSLGAADTFTDMLSQSGSLHESRKDLRKMKRLMVLQGLIDRDPGPGCEKCDAAKAMYAAVQKKFYHELEHLRRGVEQLLRHLAKYVTPGHFVMIKNKLNINVRFLTPHAVHGNSHGGSDDDDGLQRDSMASPRTLGSDEGEDEVFHRLGDLELENTRLAAERADLLAELNDLRRKLTMATAKTGAVTTNEAPCQTDPEPASSHNRSTSRFGGGGPFAGGAGAQGGGNLLHPAASSSGPLGDTLSEHGRNALYGSTQSGLLSTGNSRHPAQEGTSPSITVGGSTVEGAAVVLSSPVGSLTLPKKSAGEGAGASPRRRKSKAGAGSDGGGSGAGGKDKKESRLSSTAPASTLAAATKEAEVQEQLERAMSKEREQAANRLARVQRDLERQQAEKESLQKTLEEERTRFQRALEALRVQLQACQKQLRDNGFAVPGEDYPIEGQEGGSFGPGGPRGTLRGSFKAKSLRERHKEATERAEAEAKKAAEEAERLKAEEEAKKVSTEDKGVGPGPGAEEEAVKLNGKQLKKPRPSTPEPLVETFFEKKVRSHPMLGLGGGAGGAQAMAATKAANAATIARTEGLSAFDKPFDKDLLCAKCGAALFDETAADLKFLKAKANARAEGIRPSMLADKAMMRQSSKVAAPDVSQALQTEQLKAFAEKVKDLEHMLEDKGKEIRELHKVIANRKQKDHVRSDHHGLTKESSIESLVTTMVLPDDQLVGLSTRSGTFTPSQLAEDSEHAMKLRHSESGQILFNPRRSSTQSLHQASVQSVQSRSMPELPKAPSQASASPKTKAPGPATVAGPTRVHDISEGVVKDMPEELSAPPAPDVEPYLIHLWEQRTSQREAGAGTRGQREVLSVGATPSMSPRALTGVTTICYPPKR
mmetsp:Transcript_56705/g.104986  ORF Transcript_56705/g.104986 Transcript_56705/m.104986 type:complete len:998 (+) Transcript_56705:100-3093(+)